MRAVNAHSLTDGLIYYLLDASRAEQRLKIGYTQNLSDRLKALANETMSRQRPLVLALEAGGITLERERHDQFAALRVVGEWFRYEDPLRSFVAELPNPIGWMLDHPDLWIYAKGWQGIAGWARRYLPEDEEEIRDHVPHSDDDYQIPCPIDF